MAVLIESMKFWMNAFIPRTVLGYTREVPKGPDKGKTMIPGPLPTSDCFLSDQRAFDNYIHASSRMHAECKVDFTTAMPRMITYFNCDETKELDCVEGNTECECKGKTNRMSFVMRRPVSSRRVVLEMKCAANNPCSPSSRLFGDIDFRGVITLDRSARTVEFVGLVDQFPAFEAYATINDQGGVALFRLDPPRGNTVMNLPGDADRPVKATLVDADGDGVFEEL